MKLKYAILTVSELCILKVMIMTDTEKKKYFTPDLVCSYFAEFTVCGFFVGIQSILTISYGTSMTSASNLASMSRNFTPLMGTFFGLAFRKYGHPIVAIVIGEIIISLMFNGFVALGAPITIQNVITGIALLAIVTMTTKPVKGLVVK